MIGLIAFLLAAIAVTYAVFFCVFKLIWVLFKKDRNFWPFVLSGISTFLVVAVVAGGIWWTYHKVMTPFKPIIEDIQNNPQLVYGEQVYADNTYPFELTVFDGMSFSNWIEISTVHFKAGIDTNIFKLKDQNNTSFLTAVLAQTPKTDSEDPFAPLKEMLNSGTQQRRLELSHQEQTVVNGLPAYQAWGRVYTDKGPVDVWIGGYAAPSGDVYYIGILGIGSKNFATEATAMLNSFRLTTPQLPAQ